MIAPTSGRFSTQISTWRGAVTELHNVHGIGVRHYEESLRFLGDSVSLVEDCVQLYQRAADIAGGSPLANRDEYFMGIQFSMAARYYLVTGALACFRGHITDAYASTRMAIEQSAFAARVKRHPHLAPIWQDAGHGEAAYEEYREKFKKLFPQDNAKLRELGTRYDICAKRTHPSIHSFAGRSTVEETERHYRLKFDYFQVNDDGSELVGTFLWLLNTHIFIAAVFLVADARAYGVQANAVEAKLASHMAGWQIKIPALRPKQP
jgi:hypothetical protein